MNPDDEKFLLTNHAALAEDSRRRGSTLGAAAYAQLELARQQKIANLLRVIELNEYTLQLHIQAHLEDRRAELKDQQPGTPAFDSRSLVMSDGTKVGDAMDQIEQWRELVRQAMGLM